MKIVGYVRKVYDFVDKNGHAVHAEGLEIHLSRPVVTDGEGYYTERIFLSDAKLNGFRPAVNQEVDVLYNRYGKPASIRAI